MTANAVGDFYFLIPARVTKGEGSIDGRSYSSAGYYKVNVYRCSWHSRVIPVAQFDTRNGRSIFKHHFTANIQGVPEKNLLGDDYAKTTVPEKNLLNLRRFFSGTDDMQYGTYSCKLSQS